MAAEFFHGTQYSFREPGGVIPAMQVSVHPTKDGAWPYFFEIDFDYASPSGGVKSFFIHTGEVIAGFFGAKTNQERIAHLLKARLEKEKS